MNPKSTIQIRNENGVSRRINDKESAYSNDDDDGNDNKNTKKSDRFE